MADRPLLVWGAETSRKSLGEMQALADALRVELVVLPRGKLGVHEEFASDVGSAIRSFLPAVGG
jgi:pimeloyl-ACP methyl ester carboxylesterase